MSTYRNPEEWLTPAQAAPELGLNVQTVRQMCADKAINRRVRFGPAGNPRYSIQRRDIDAYNRKARAA